MDYTPNLNLFKYDTAEDGKQVFSIDTALNDNWDILDERVSQIRIPLLTTQWSDHILNDVSWLRADTFSWQSGSIYTGVYDLLTEQLATCEDTISETIGSTTIEYFKTENGMKIVTADQAENVSAIYEETGCGWYYILDTENQQFKLPRNKHGFTGLRTSVGDIVEAGLPNIEGTIPAATASANTGTLITGAFVNTGVAPSKTYNASTGEYQNTATSFSASRSNSIYGNSDTVQPPAVQMYLYFYVGGFSQSATEQTAGLNSELFNGKVDTDLGNFEADNLNQTQKDKFIGWGMPDYTAGVSTNVPMGEANAITMSFRGIWVVCKAISNTYADVYINGVQTAFRILDTVSGVALASMSIPVDAGDSVYINDTYTSELNIATLYPYKGVNND